MAAAEMEAIRPTAASWSRMLFGSSSKVAYIVLRVLTYKYKETENFFTFLRTYTTGVQSFSITTSETCNNHSVFPQCKANGQHEDRRCSDTGMHQFLQVSMQF